MLCFLFEVSSFVGKAPYLITGIDVRFHTTIDSQLCTANMTDWCISLENYPKTPRKLCGEVIHPLCSGLRESLLYKQWLCCTIDAHELGQWGEKGY